MVYIFFGKSFKLIKMNSFFSFQMEEILHQKIKRAHQSQLCSGYDWGTSEGIQKVKERRNYMGKSVGYNFFRQDSK